MFLSILFFSLLFLIKTLLSHFCHRVFLFIPLFSLAVISSVISLPLLLFLFSFFLYLLIYFFFPSSGSLPSFSFILVFFCFLSVKVSRPNIFLKYLNLIAQHPFCLVLFSQTFSRVVPGFLILISQIRRCFFRWSPELELYFFVCLQLLSFLLVHIFTFFSIFFLCDRLYISSVFPSTDSNNTSLPYFCHHIATCYVLLISSQQSLTISDARTADELLLFHCVQINTFTYEITLSLLGSQHYFFTYLFLCEGIDIFS